MPPPRRKFDPDAPRKGDRRRELLLETAEQLLDEMSAESLTIDEVSARAGLSRSGVYFYFDSKWALIDTLIDARTDELLEQSMDHIATSPRAVIEQFVATTLRAWRTHTALFRAAVERASHGGDVTAAWRASMTKTSRAMVQVLTTFDEVDFSAVGDLGTVAEMAGWMAERNFYMLFSREHTDDDEQRLAHALTEASLRIVGIPG